MDVCSLECFVFITGLGEQNKVNAPCIEITKKEDKIALLKLIQPLLVEKGKGKKEK